MSAAIEIDGLTKRFGQVEAVSDLSFEVGAGRVTGFLGPNGAGKSTTLRMLLGLVHANAGRGTFHGRRYEELPHPSAHVGVVLEEASFHPSRSGRNHLRVLAAAGNHPDSRVDEVLATVELTHAANRRVKGYSMGMRQRLAIAAALLGDPEVLILDEPANGLDPPGIRWMRDMLRAEAARGRAVLVSSHLLSEVAQAADDVVVIAGGVLRASGSLESVLGGPDGPVTRVRAREAERLAAALGARGLAVERAPAPAAAAAPERAAAPAPELLDGPERAAAPAPERLAGPEHAAAPAPERLAALLVRGASPEAVGAVAAEHGIALSELVAVSRSLEDAFFELTAEAA
jgi:ABC-2 type transport system ATP-binding protein